MKSCENCESTGAEFARVLSNDERAFIWGSTAHMLQMLAGEEKSPTNERMITAGMQVLEKCILAKPHDQRDKTMALLLPFGIMASFGQCNHAVKDSVSH